MPCSITIRDVPDETVNALKARAAASGLSLEQYLRGRLVEQIGGRDLAGWLAAVRARKARSGVRLSSEDILVLRGTDRY